MNKSTIRTVGIALFLMLAVTFPVSAGVTVYEINSDDSRTVIDSSNSHTILVVQGTDGEITISEDSIIELPNYTRSITVTSDSDPVHIVDESGSIDTYHVDVVEPSATIDAFAATIWHYACAENYQIGRGCAITSSNYGGGASACSSDTTLSCNAW